MKNIHVLNLIHSGFVYGKVQSIRESVHFVNCLLWQVCREKSSGARSAKQWAGNRSRKGEVYERFA